jgi:hypothetical protein
VENPACLGGAGVPGGKLYNEEVLDWFIRNGDRTFLIYDYIVWPLEELGGLGRHTCLNACFHACCGSWLEHWMVEVVDTCTRVRYLLEFHLKGVEMTEFSARVAEHPKDDVQGVRICRVACGPGALITGVNMAQMVQPWSGKKYKLATRNCQHFVHYVDEVVGCYGWRLTPAQRVLYGVS